MYNSTSPYFTTNITKDNYLDLMVNRPIPRYSSDVLWTITVQYQYRPDLLAYDLYNNSKLWWVFAQRNPNKLVDPYFDFVEGVSIYIPRQEVLQNILGI